MLIPEGAYAVPPLVTGDVPTAEKNHVELFIGTLYQDTGSIERQIPFTEVVYGISDRQEVTSEIQYLSIKDNQGLGDITLGTKYQFLKESDRFPGIASSFEVKLPNGNQAKELGTGAMNYDLRLRSQKTWDWFTAIINLGYTFVGEPEVNGVRQKRNNILFSAFAQEFEIHYTTKILSEIYWRNNDKSGDSDRLAGNIGFKHHLLSHLSVHATVGKSLREENLGGPNLRIYTGILLEF
ncbi:MAG: transporter [Nitrospinae bacterium]|nr:transporter [Nitrospinota bacterium]